MTLSTPAPTLRGAARKRITVVVLATAATAAFWLLAHSAFHVGLEARVGGSTVAVSLPSVVAATLLAGLLAWALLAVLDHNGVGRRPFAVICWAAYAVSLLGPAGGVTPGAKAILICLHLVAVLIIIPGLASTARES